MQLQRRRFLHLAMGATAFSPLPKIAAAQTYPLRPVRLIVGFPAGGAQDIVARLMGQWLSERLGQPIVIENRPGAGGNIGAEAAVRAMPDGYTLLLAGTPNAINATLYGNLSFVFLRDIAPVAAIIRVPTVMVVNPSLPARSVPEFIAYAKSNPGKINMGSAGTGSSPHAAGELFKMMAGVNLVHIPYRGASAAITDLIGGQLQVIFETMPPAIGYIRAGQLRALAVTTATRSEALPDVPTVASFVPGYEASASYGIGAPKDTPAEIIRRLNTEINAGLADHRMKARFAEMGGAVLPGAPAEFGRLIAEETEKWGKVMKISGGSPD